MNFNSNEELAAEYVLGLLDAENDAIAEQAIIKDVDLRRRAVHWSFIFSSIRMKQYKASQPPRWLWSSIENRLPKASTNPKWSFALAASLAVFALTAILWVALPNLNDDYLSNRHAELAPLIAGAPLWQVEASGDLNSILIKLTRGKVSTETGVPVLWVLMQDGTPRLIGELPFDGERRISLKGLVDSDFSTRLAISLEPKDIPLGHAPRGEVVLVANWDERR